MMKEFVFDPYGSTLGVSHASSRSIAETHTLTMGFDPRVHCLLWFAIIVKRANPVSGAEKQLKFGRLAGCRSNGYTGRWLGSKVERTRVNDADTNVNESP